MAFEDMTYETLNSRMMDRVTANYPELDTREGSMVFQAIAAAAMEFSIIYEHLDSVLDQAFIGTASLDNAIRICQQAGMDISQFDATYASFEAEFNIAVPLGSRWNLDQYNSAVRELISSSTTYKYVIDCETPGSGPNAITGNLTPVEYIEGNLTLARINSCLVPGEDEATTDQVVDAYYSYVTHQANNGNAAQYVEWANEFDGIGQVKVMPLWNGIGTVKVSILDYDGDPASDELIDAFQEYLDPDEEGLGNGMAPIGAKVTVSTATTKAIDVSATITFKEGYSDTTELDNAISAFFREMSYKRDSVPYMNIGSVLVNLESVDFITGMLVDGGTADIPLGDEEVPVLGTATWTVV